MMCSSPSRILTKTKDGEELLLEVPCGRCIQCRIARSREWTCRLTAELSSWDAASFVTLTFSDENYGKPSLDKRDLQLFFKRLRKKLDGRKIKYFACGEYGDTFGRKHYHCLIYGLSVNEGRLIIPDVWPFGRISCDRVNSNRIAYVAGYVQKKLYRDKDFKREHADLLPPFQLISKGLGVDFMNDNSKQLIQNLYVKDVTGKSYALPRYYKRKLEIPTERLHSLSVDSKIELMHSHGISDFDESDAESVEASYYWFSLTNNSLARERIQSTKNALAKKSNFGKRS